jgi:hypothetical protein
LVINLQVRDTTDCLGIISVTLHGHFVHTYNRIGLYEMALCKKLGLDWPTFTNVLSNIGVYFHTINEF